jgi:hypothetical protein
MARTTGYGVWWFRVLSLCSLCLCGSLLHGQTSYPMVMCLRPVAVQVGQTSECEMVARYDLSGAYQVFVTGAGVTATVVEAKKGPASGKARTPSSTITLRFQVAADALPGVRDVRVATPQGASTLGQLVVVRDPVVRETAGNDTLQTAQAIPLPAAVCGAIEKLEDVDYYKFKVAAGTGLTFHVLSQRLQNRIHDLQDHTDPIINLRNAVGTILASSDNYFYGDPLLHYRFAMAGDYYLEIRDTRYGGNANWQYCIEINDRPFVTNVYPSRVVPGHPTRLRLIGHNLPADPFVSLTLPDSTPEGVQWVTLPLAKDRSNSVPVIVSRLPEVVEAEGSHATAATAQAVTVPCGIGGCIARGGETDCYAFEARAGERFTFEVMAREHQSGLDSLLRIFNARGQRLLENDDARDRYVHADSLIENWTAPAAGRYVVELSDLHGRGGPTFVYFLKITRSEPSFTLEIDSDKTLLSAGAASPVFVRITRKNGFTGEVQLEVDGLPPGVTATCGRILPSGRDGCIILQAARDAKQASANLRIRGTAPRPDGKGVLEATAQPLQEIYMPGGGRSHFPVEMHTLSIGAPLDLQAVKITPAAVTLRPGESKKIEVTIERIAGFKGNVTLDTVYQHLNTIYGSSMPAGVRIDDKTSQTLLTGDRTKGVITLKAAPDAEPVKDQVVPVMAHVSINFVMKHTCCSEPLRLTVEKAAR